MLVDILIGVYVIVAVCLLIAIYREAPAHRAKVGPQHWLVALVWPYWVGRYLWSLFSDWNDNRKAQRIA